jgi:hypothetical protein
VGRLEEQKSRSQRNRMAQAKPGGSGPGQQRLRQAVPLTSERRLDFDPQEGKFLRALERGD